MSLAILPCLWPSSPLRTIVKVPLTSYFLNLASEGQGQKTDPLYRRLRQEQWFPADWKYMLGLLILFFMTLAGRA
jgi:hypothetical protein